MHTKKNCHGRVEMVFKLQRCPCCFIIQQNMKPNFIILSIILLIFPFASEACIGRSETSSKISNIQTSDDSEDSNNHKSRNGGPGFPPNGPDVVSFFFNI